MFCIVSTLPEVSTLRSGTPTPLFTSLRRDHYTLMITMCRLQKATSACPHSGFCLYCLAYVAFTCLFILICQTLRFIALSTFLYFTVIYFISEAGRHGGDPPYWSQHFTSHFLNSVLASRTFSHLAKRKIRRLRRHGRCASSLTGQLDCSSLTSDYVAYPMSHLFSRVLPVIASQKCLVTPHNRPVSHRKHLHEGFSSCRCQSAILYGHAACFLRGTCPCSHAPSSRRSLHRGLHRPSSIPDHKE